MSRGKRIFDKRTYNCWFYMKQRCTNPDRKDYPRYGGRGITVCDRWMLYQNFLEDMGVMPEGLTLDRVDGSLGYSPENCRWADYVTQNNNRTYCKTYTYSGETLTVTQWARKLNVSLQTLRYRLKNKTIEQALNNNYKPEAQ